MLALVAVVELIVSARRLDFTTVWADDWRRSALAATRQAPSRDVLVFGDSLVKFSVLPKRIESKTGLRAYNLALNAGTMPSAYFMLRRTLEAGARPKVIVADFCALMQPDRPIRSIRLYPDMATLRDVLDLSWTSGDADFLASTLLGKLLPSYKCRYEIRESVKAAFDGRRASPWPAQSNIWVTWKLEDGAQPMPSNGQGGWTNAEMVRDLSPTRWECDAINAAYVEKFLKLAESRQIPVVWLIPPLHPEVHSLRAVQGSDEAYTRFVEVTVSRHPGVMVLDARRSGYDRTLYIDTIHLGRQGAESLSTDLARLLLDRIGHPPKADRWVQLPRYEPRKAEVADAPSAGLRK
jgi:hypothetical protein